MASEMRRAARLLVESKAQSFESRHSPGEALARLKSILGSARSGAISRGIAGQASPEGVVLFEYGKTPRSANALFEGSWRAEGDRARLEGAFKPTSRARRFLRMSSFALSAFVAASILVYVASTDEVIRYLVPFLTVLSILGFPMAVLGMASQREAEEARIAKAVRAALAGEEDKLPPPQKYADED